MRPSDLIKNDLGEEVWAMCRPRGTSKGELSPVDWLSPFQSSKTYIIRGKTKQFDFPTLPHGSFCIYDANGKRAVRLTRAGREIESVLKENWNVLTSCDPVVLANLILTFLDGGIRSTHRVLTSANALLSQGNNYVLDEQEFMKSQERIGITSVSQREDAVVIRTLTLSGWMHAKRNLGIEHIHISKSGVIHLEKREVLSTKIFKSVPQVRY